MEKTLYSTGMQHEMSSLVYAVSFAPETPNFGTFGGVAHPPEEFFKKICFLSVYMHIFEN